MLYNKEECEWSFFTQEPLKFSTSTLSKYFSILTSDGYVEKVSRGHYKITPEGRKQFNELLTAKEKKRKINYPTEAIMRRRNYDHWILWMTYNNNFCVWSDFLAEDSPARINQSSLSKNMNLLISKGFIEKEEKKYRITRSGKLEYSRMLKFYDLDRQSILDEESKRIEEITNKTIIFFKNYDIKDENIQFRFLNNVLKLDYSRVESMLTDEDDFDKILLFLSINHPDQFPDYIQISEFSEQYEIKKSKLEYYIDEIIENNIYPIKFFKINVSSDEHYYFQENETLEIMLRAITEDHITKFTYLNKLFTRSLNVRSILNDILGKITHMLFNEELREPLREFLSDYINYLAYKIEAKVEFKETLDKLEGIIWREMADIFQKRSSEDIDEKYEEEINRINKKIKNTPRDLDLYNSKIRTMIYYGQFDDALELLEEMLKLFPENEKDIKMKEASVLRRIHQVEDGLKIINDLIVNYPDDYDLVNYKAYWLQYLNSKEEALEVIQDLVKKIPENGLYRDTYGEILMYFEEYKMALTEFLKTVEIAENEWYINQTYIKLGICYKELKEYDLALENLQKGRDLTNESDIDPEMKQKWLTIAELFITEIGQIE
ncbi:MAG: tetratricopeptide repeat protein [Promethearchaeota archaeon]|jgi:Mn-dependent DtxR family transcriptional regulator/Flp pilus assembly protein TadD